MRQIAAILCTMLSFCALGSFEEHDFVWRRDSRNVPKIKKRRCGRKVREQIETVRPYSWLPTGTRSYSAIAPRQSEAIFRHLDKMQYEWHIETGVEEVAKGSIQPADFVERLGQMRQRLAGFLEQVSERIEAEESVDVTGAFSANLGRYRLNLGWVDNRPTPWFASINRDAWEHVIARAGTIKPAAFASWSYLERMKYALDVAAESRVFASIGELVVALRSNDVLYVQPHLQDLELNGILHGVPEEIRKRELDVVAMRGGEIVFYEVKTSVRNTPMGTGIGMEKLGQIEFLQKVQKYCRFRSRIVVISFSGYTYDFIQATPRGVTLLGPSD